MLRLLLGGLLLAASPLCAQTLASGGADKLLIVGNYATVEITTSPDGTIRYEHSVTVNGQPVPDIGEITSERSGGTLTLRESQPTSETIGELCRDARNKRYRENCNSRIRLRVAVPAGLRVEVETVYGAVEATDQAGLARVHSTYGALEVVYDDVAPPAELDLYSNYGEVDLSLPADVAAEVELVTQYGSLLTDFDIAIDAAASEQRAFYERVVGTLGAGGGTRVTCRSPYDTVYLRRSE